MRTKMTGSKCFRLLGRIVSALNHGIRHSTTPLIARMDADDRMLGSDSAHRSISWRGTLVRALFHARLNISPPRQTTRVVTKVFVDWTNKLLSHEEISLNRFVESPFAHPSVLLLSKACLMNSDLTKTVISPRTMNFGSGFFPVESG